MRSVLVLTITQNILNLVVNMIIFEIIMRKDLRKLGLNQFLSLTASVVKRFAEFFFITIINFDLFQFRQFFIWVVSLFLFLLVLARFRKRIIFYFCDTFNFLIESFFCLLLFADFNFLCNFFCLFGAVILNLINTNLFVL